MARKNIEVYVIGIIVIISFFFLILNFFPKSVELSISPLSLVNGISGVSEIDFTIKIFNTGSYDLSCSLISATPSAFDSALDKSPKVVLKGKTVLWTSNKISTSQFEGLPNPDRFSITARCSYNSGSEIKYLPDANAYIDLNINPENKPVNFRTSDSSYPKIAGATVIGYSEQCSPTLILYKEKSRSCWTVTSSTCPSRSGFTLLMDQSKKIPGFPIGSNNQVGCLYRDNSDYTNLVMAWKTVSSGGMCTITGQWQTITLDSKLSNQLEINNSWISIDKSKEVLC